ncbi:AAA family ATPase [Rhodopila sp.]|uniref:AAA family ATPase n=1 Tax=Rhodopila sp. TaxID=2480087 RepID=UPI003D11372C
MSASPSTELARLMEPVAIEVLGEPNPALSNKTEMRWGSRGGLCVNRVKGTWVDHTDGDRGGGVLDLLRVMKGLDKPDALHWLREQKHLPPAKTNGSRRIVETYDYMDASGALLFQVVRYEPKDFLQRAPDGTGGWVWKTGRVKKVLYRLPEVIAAVAAGQTIFVAEGEKGVHSLESIGLIGTCSPGGAGKWKREYGEFLADARVVVLSDNDPQAMDPDGTPRWHPDGRPVTPGQDHAAEVAKNLRGVAAQVRVFMLPDLPEKGDIADWVDAGGTRVTLVALVAAAAEPPEEADPRPHQQSDEGTDGWAEAADADPAIADALSVITWASMDIKPEVRMLGDFITSSTRAFLVGSTGLGKTLLAYGMAGGMATGTGFLHWTCSRPSKWLIIDGEMPSALVKARAADLIRRAGGVAVPPHGVMIYSRDRAEEFAKSFPNLGNLPPLNTEAGHTFVRSLIAAIGGVEGVIFDNVMSLAPGDQKDEEVWGGCIPLVESLSRVGIAQLWCDHTGHNAGRQYGSSVKSWRFDCVGIMTPLADADRPSDHVAFQLSFDSPGKARRRTPDNWQDFEPIIIRLINDRWTGEPAIAPRAVSREEHLPDKPALMLMGIRNALQERGRKQEIGEDQVLAVARSTVRDRLIQAGWFPDHLLCRGSETKADAAPAPDPLLSPAFPKPTLTRAGYTAETNGLNSLKRRDLVGFNRLVVWQK